MSEIEDTKGRINNNKTKVHAFSTNLNKGGMEMSSAGKEGEVGMLMNISVTLTKKARMLIRDLDPENDLAFLRIKTKSKELMVSPDKELIFVVLQNLEDNKSDDK